MKKRESSLKKKSGIADSDSIGFALMLAPFAILFILFTVLPVISSIVLSIFFLRYDFTAEIQRRDKLYAYVHSG